MGVDPTLHKSTTSYETKVEVLTAFASRVRRGTFGFKRTVGVQTVQVAIRSIGKTVSMAHGYNPVYRSDQKYLEPIEMQLEGFRRIDPLPSPELAVPVEVAWWLSDFGTCDAASEKNKAAGDLGNIAFYFLLRVGEYSVSTKKRKRTVQFRLKDVSFMKNNLILDPKSPLEVLLTADAATLLLSNQKNGVRGALIHHHALSTRKQCPVRALARRVAHLHKHAADPDELLCAYFDHLGKSHVTNNDMLKLVRAAGVALQLEKKGFPSERLGTHSLRAGGAMAMAVNGETDRNIKKMGRWSTDTFLMYIHEQISHLTKGISDKMSQPFPFFNVDGGTSKITRAMGL